MEFEGHDLYKIDSEWVFDLTTFIGYHVTLSSEYPSIVKGYTKAFITVFDKDSGSYSFEKLTDIPMRIMRKVVDLIQKYRKEALLEYSN